MTGELNHRVIAMLRAVANGNAEMTCSCEPDLYVDGVCVCDQFTAHRLAEEGLIRLAYTAPIGSRVRAELSASGRAVLTQGLAAA